MYRLYDKSFKTGFIATLLIFGLLNIVDYIAADRQYAEYLSQPVKWAPASPFPSWGFPFHWRGYNLGYIEDGLVLNFIVIAGVGFIVGCLVRFLTNIIKKRKRV